MLSLAQGLGGGPLILLGLLLLMAAPVLIAVGVAVYLTRPEWQGDRKDNVEKDLDAHLGASGDDDE